MAGGGGAAGAGQLLWQWEVMDCSVGSPEKFLALKQHKWYCDFIALAKGCVFLCSLLVRGAFSSWWGRWANTFTLEASAHSSIEGTDC